MLSKRIYGLSKRNNTDFSDLNGDNTSLLRVIDILLIIITRILLQNINGIFSLSL